MIKIRTLLLVSLTTLLIVACENELPHKLKEKPPKLIMNALINSDSLNNTLFLNMSHQSLLGDVADATVEVRVNGKLRETAQLLPKMTNDETGKRFRITTAFAPSDIVRIDATTTDGKHHAWAETTVPSPLTIERLDTISTRIRYNGSLRNVLRYRLTFVDRPKEKNFYRLVIEQHLTECIALYESQSDTTIHSKSTRIISGDDIALSDGQLDMGNSNSLFEKSTNIYGIFDDSRLGNSAYTMTAYTDRYNMGQYAFDDLIKWMETDIYVRLLSISETEYYYLRALNIIDSDIYDTTMMEPIKFASNVNGGLGIVSISAETSAKVSLPKYVNPAYD